MASPSTIEPHPPLELWAGLECTLNRVRDEQNDQLALAGHYDRTDDLDRIAALGIRTLRYPVLWERVAAGTPHGAPWEWTTRQLERLRTLGIRPIVGLVHHGSGPRDTNLLDDGFADGLARFASDVARRFPWLTHFTPINEPLTTARFSALYGHWYPHARDETLFWRALLNQIRATRLAMGAIRRIIPDAQLVQTEDLGRTHCSPVLQYQADFENERRWLTGDLLTGRVGPGHPMWEYALSCGIHASDIQRAVGDGCPPDLLGINYYITSERFIDERLARYPQSAHGGNGRHRYADVEAVRVLPPSHTGLEPLLAEAADRYGIPLAITEVHLGCTREQQVRWLAQAWNAAGSARSKGIDVRAVTAWAALGAHGWSSLVTEPRSSYEPGLFDTRSRVPRLTAVGKTARALAITGRVEMAVADDDGWWQLPERVLYGERVAAASPRSDSRPILIAGASGTLGAAFVRICRQRGLACRPMSRAELDVCDRASVDAALRDTRAWAVVNAAGYVRVDDAEHDGAACHAANVCGAFILATACEARGVSLVTYSSDLVFDGRKRTPYVESDIAAPLGAYGLAKAQSEEHVLSVMPNALVIRSAAFFGPWDEWNFVTRTLNALEEGRLVPAAHDLVVSPTYVPDLVNATLDLLIDGEQGIWHLTNEGAVSWADLGRMAARACGMDAALVRPLAHSQLGYTALRPSYAALGSERGRHLPPLEDALARYRNERAYTHEPSLK